MKKMIKTNPINASIVICEFFQDEIGETIAVIFPSNNQQNDAGEDQKQIYNIQEQIIECVLKASP
jgi:hypothetical protein